MDVDILVNNWSYFQFVNLKKSGPFFKGKTYQKDIWLLRLADMTAEKTYQNYAITIVDSRD